MSNDICWSLRIIIFQFRRLFVSCVGLCCASFSNNSTHVLLGCSYNIYYAYTQVHTPAHALFSPHLFLTYFIIVAWHVFHFLFSHVEFHFYSHLLIRQKIYEKSKPKACFHRVFFLSSFTSPWQMFSFSRYWTSYFPWHNIPNMGNSGVFLFRSQWLAL